MTGFMKQPRPQRARSSITLRYVSHEGTGGPNLQRALAFGKFGQLEGWQTPRLVNISSM